MKTRLLISLLLVVGIIVLAYVLPSAEARSFSSFRWDIDEAYHRDGHVQLVVQKGSENFLPIGIKGLDDVTVTLHPTINHDQTGKAKLPQGVDIYFEPNVVTLTDGKVKPVKLIINVDENAPANLYDVQIVSTWKDEDKVPDFMGSSIRLHVGHDFGDGKIPTNMLESPLKFWKLIKNEGGNAEDVPCRNDYVLVVKHDGSPACVTPETKKKLIERSWIKSDYQDGITVNFSFCGADGFDSEDNPNKTNSTHTWDENYCKWTKKDIPKITPLRYSETITDNNPYNNELIIFQKDGSVPLQYDKTKQAIDETFLSKTVAEWQKVSRGALMEEHKKYLPEHRFFDHLGSFLIKNEFQNIMDELDIVNEEDDFEVKGGMSLTSLPPHNSYYSIIKANDGNYYRLQGETHANEVNVSKVSALLFFDTSVDFKMEDLVSENQLFTILPESNKPEIDPSNLIIHTNNSKVEFYNNTPEVIRIQDSGTGRVGEEHLLDWVGPTILPYTTASMTFGEPGNFDFNARFAPNLENPLWWSTHTSGTIIVMSDDMSSVSREEKNKMVQSLLFDLGLPVVSAGTGNADNVLSVGLDPSVVESIPNATQYYKERIEQIFPFEIVLDIED